MIWLTCAFRMLSKKKIKNTKLECQFKNEEDIIMLLRKFWETAMRNQPYFWSLLFEILNFVVLHYLFDESAIVERDRNTKQN